MLSQQFMTLLRSRVILIIDQAEKEKRINNTVQY